MSIDECPRKGAKERSSDTVRVRTLLAFIAVFAVILSVSAGRIRSERQRRSEALRRQIEAAAVERGIVANHYRKSHASLLKEAEIVRGSLKRAEAHQAELIRDQGPERVAQIFSSTKGDPLRIQAGLLRRTLARAERFRVMALILEWSKLHPDEPIPPLPSEPRDGEPPADLERYIPSRARDHEHGPISTVVKKAG